MKRYYLHATGCTCYDRTGITFPEPKISIPIEELAHIFFGYNTETVLQRQFNWNNQHEVLTFSATEDKAKLFQTALNKFCNAFIVKVRNW